jgi:hypothetical protein
MGEPELEITVTKASAYLMVSDEVLMDMGIIPDTRPPPPPIPWRRRRRWRWLELREALAVRAYAVIAGYPPPDPEDWA